MKLYLAKKKRSESLSTQSLICMLLYGRDHAGGNDKIKQLVPGIKVFGGSVDNVKGCTDQVDNGDKISLGADINILCLHTPWYSIDLVKCRFFLGPSLLSSLHFG